MSFITHGDKISGINYTFRHKMKCVTSKLLIYKGIFGSNLIQLFQDHVCFIPLMDPEYMSDSVNSEREGGSNVAYKHQESPSKCFQFKWPR